MTIPKVPPVGRVSDKRQQLSQSLARDEALLQQLFAVVVKALKANNANVLNILETHAKGLHADLPNLSPNQVERRVLRALYENDALWRHLLKAFDLAKKMGREVQ